MIVLLKQRSQSVAAGATVPSFYTGTRFEYAPVSGNLNLYLTASQLGATARLLIGAGEAAESSELSARNAFPLVPDDLFIPAVPIVEGQKITLEITNTAGTATTVFARLEIDV